MLQSLDPVFLISTTDSVPLYQAGLVVSGLLGALGIVWRMLVHVLDREHDGIVTYLESVTDAGIAAADTVKIMNDRDEKLTNVEAALVELLAIAHRLDPDGVRKRGPRAGAG